MFFFTGCRLYTAEDYKQELLGKYYGANAEQLVIDLGMPNNVMNIGNMLLIVYEYKSVSYIPKSYRGRTTTSSLGGSNFSIEESGGYNLEYWCKTTFFLRQHKVFDVKFVGNSCFREGYVWK